MGELIDVYEWKEDALEHVGIMDKVEAEQQGMWHKIARVHPVKKVDGEYYVILQRRGRYKRIGALNFAIAVSEHIKAGESDIDACVRGIKEELGIDISKGELNEAYSLKFIHDTEKIKERTYCTTYMLNYTQDLKKFILQKEEVEGVYLVPVKGIMDVFEEKRDMVEVTGIGLNKDETDYIDDITTISKSKFTSYDFYREDLIKLGEYIDHLNLEK